MTKQRVHALAECPGNDENYDIAIEIKIGRHHWWIIEKLKRIYHIKHTTKLFRRLLDERRVQVGLEPTVSGQLYEDVRPRSTGVVDISRPDVHGPGAVSKGGGDA